MPDGSATPIEALRVQQSKPDKSATPEPSQTPQMAQPNRSLGDSVEYYARRLMKPLLIGVAATTLLKGGGDLINKPSGEEDTGYRPNQPGQHNDSPQPAIESNQEYHQNTWADRIRLILEGKLEPKEGEEAFLRNLIVKQTEEDPNVRDGFPSTMTNASLDGTPPKEVPVLGKLPAGTIISHGLEVIGSVNGQEKKWVAFLASELQGKAVDANGNPVQFENPSQVVTVLKSYLTAQPAQQAQTP